MNTVVISLTTIKKREKLVINTIKSLLSQETEYDYIINLNISTEPFLLDEGFSLNDIKNLEKTINDNKLKINICENIGSLRKIVPTLQQYRDNIVITVDDDTSYHNTMIQTYVDNYKKHNCIIGSRGRIINFNNSNIMTNLRFVSSTNNSKVRYIILEGVGGILYHSSYFNENFYNYNFLKCKKDILTNDDLVIRAWTINISVVIVPIRYYDSQPNYGLWFIFNKQLNFNFVSFLELFYKKINIGKCTNKYTKEVKLNTIYPPETKIFFFHKYKDMFSWKFINNSLLIERTDEKKPWDQDLVAFVL